MCEACHILTNSVIIVGQSEVRCWGDMRSSSTLKKRKTWAWRMGTWGSRRLSTRRSETTLCEMLRTMYTELKISLRAVAFSLKYKSNKYSRTNCVLSSTQSGSMTHEKLFNSHALIVFIASNIKQVTMRNDYLKMFTGVQVWGVFKWNTYTSHAIAHVQSAVWKLA